MRRKEKHIYGGAALGGMITGLSDMLIQYFNLKEGDSFWKNWNAWRTLRITSIGASIGAGTGYVIYKTKRSSEERLPFNASKYLHSILNDLNISSNPQALSIVLEIRDEITEFVIAKFGDILSSKPEYSGSFFKRTAINSNFDFDIVLPFSKDSFHSLEEMYETTYEAILDEFSNESTEVRRQKRSIGITFSIDDFEYHFDIVPGREINNYKIDGELNLYVAPSNIFKNSTSTKTNIRAHKSITLNRPIERKIIKLLKFYRDENCLTIPSVVIQNIVIEAFDHKKAIPYSLYHNFIYAMEYMADKIFRKTLKDLSNTNNNIMDKISHWDREAIADQLNSDLDKLKNDKRYLKEIFEI